MSTISLSVVVLCVGLLAAALLSQLVPTLHLPSSSVSSSALLEAAYLGDLGEVRRLLAVHNNLSHSQPRQHPQRSLAALARDSRNNTALHVRPATRTRSITHSHARTQASQQPRPSVLCQWAVKSARADSLAVVDALIAAGASLLSVNAAGTTPLHWSVHSDSDTLITGIIHRLCPQLADSQRAPPLPATSQPTSSVARLPVCGALLAVNERNESVLHWAVDWQKAVSVTTLLSIADGSVSSVSSTAAASRELVDRADVNGDTPLHRLPIDCPTSASCRLIAQQVIARGANVTAENAARRTPLAHFPTPTLQPDGEDSSAQGRVDELDGQAEQFRRNITQHFNRLQ